MPPKISVIITTCQRPHLVTRAVHSVLRQTFEDLELIVVLDGADLTTFEALDAIQDDRVRIHVKETRGGQPAAINTGVALAWGRWIALLDDDDEWMPEKLATQLASAEQYGGEPVVVGCRFLARSEQGDVCWPLRLPRTGERIDEYLFCRTRVAFGEGIVPTSMFFAPAAVFRAYPMDERIPKHCDLDWLIRVAGTGARFILPDTPEPLAIWHMQAERDRLSNQQNWRFSCQWIANMRPFITDRAYAGFLLTWASASARAQSEYSAASFLLREAFRSGRPNFRELAVYAAVWVLPQRVRSSISRALSATSKSGGGKS
jgi:glycosyltransferase involved in cell wall biosynthesis